MSSSSRCCATGVVTLPSLLLLPLFLSLVCGVQGATLREHRLSESEPVSYGPASQIRPPPSAEMLRALRYIQSLSQRTPPGPLDDQQDTSDDMESVRSLLQLAAPARMDRGMDERDEEKDNTQELLQAVLTTLKQTEEQMVPQKTSQKGIAPSQPRYTVQSFPRPKQQLEVETSAENYGRTSWTNPDKRRRHRKFPLVFKDQEQPLKRTNEKAEEQYTPQKLATLQSVFEQLSGIAASKANSKREYGEEDYNVDNDFYRQRRMVLEDIMGTDEWAPLEEQSETEEEERERHGFNRNLEDDEQEEEEDEEDDYVKRSNQPDWFQTRKEEEPEDIAKLVDYYLLKILENKKQEQQKKQEASKSEQESDREVERKDVDEDDGEEEDEEEREIKPMHSTFPESLSKIISISQKLRIPPEEVLELLHNEKQKDLLGIPKELRTPYTTPHKTFTAAPHRRPLEATEGNSISQDIVNFLKLVNTAQQNNHRPAQPETSRYYERKTSRDDNDEEDELANYLALKMFEHGQRRARLAPLRDEDQPVYERGYYFDKSTAQKRPANHENAVTGLDNNTMLQILRYLDPEGDDADEIDSEGKTVPEM
ncbi:secretogranin-2a-like [Carassius carassius]|uniref:secretogranin-2a-like n=1 Tax=Carassius carassius TaxID=217509 RepID=UPI002868C525|nr:secretogranin-2a-like [Carassius carassius]